MSKIAIIIPCYNEEMRLKSEIFKNFLAHKDDLNIFLVNDGSTDHTLEIIQTIKLNNPDIVDFISLTHNKGKANAIREGVLEVVKKEQFTHIGYLDADLSTSLDEFYKICKKQSVENKDYIFGSRIKMLNNTIERSLFRHLAGRFLATIIDSRYKLGIYDTQCGAKCFSKKLIGQICTDPFKTKWFFDVEIFLRIRNNYPTSKGIEYPLSIWKNCKGSKISFLKFPTILKDLFRLFKNYRTQ